MIPYPNIRPEIFTIGPLSVRWYGFMYVLGYVFGFLLLKGRARAGLFRVSYQNCESNISHLIIGMILGARLTYALVYNWPHYSEHPLDIFKVWEGGLSFHGAALGMVVASWIFARRHKLYFYEVTDALAFCSAPGLFFGRIGNFINAELYGRVTDVPWAMVFPTDPQQLPRHPSQLYQGVTEGLFLGLCLYFFQNYLLSRKKFRFGLVGGTFLAGYGLIRFVIEFFREPDAQLGFIFGSLSMGQLLCLIMIGCGVGVLIHAMKTMPIFELKKPKVQFLES